MAKIFVDGSQVTGASIEILKTEDIRHLAQVLRIKKGDRLEVSDGEKWEYVCEIEAVEKDRIEARILDKQAFAREPELSVTLFQGIPKSDKMEDVIVKCTELGVRAIVPVFTERTVVTDKGNFQKKRERWQKLANEAVKQCRRGRIPEIMPEMRFKEALTALEAFELVLFPYENEEDYSIKDCLRGLPEKPKSAAIIIGPEGGFSDGEAASLKEMGARCVTLGRTILRTQTAAQTALAMTMYELEL